MALIGVWGHSCVGKTTWLKSIMDDLPDLLSGISVVIADNEQLYDYDANQDAWIYEVNRKRWKGTKVQKAQWPIGDLILSDRMYVLDSMRYFNGLQPQMIEAHRHGGYLAMILPYTTPDIYREFQRQRCITLNKPMSPWWEVEENLLKEIKYRAGSAEKWWKPNGVLYKLIEIDEQRCNWVIATQTLKGWIKEYARTASTH